MWRKYQPNPQGKTVGDCSVRAISSALGVNWYTAYDLLCAEGRVQNDMPNANVVWGNVLRLHGFDRYILPNSCPDCYTAEDFARDHAKGTYVLAFGGHVATVIDGVILDTWNSSNEIPIYYFKRRH